MASGNKLHEYGLKAARRAPHPAQIGCWSSACITSGRKQLTAISYIAVAVLAVIMILRWQKNRTLDIPVQNR